MELNCNYSQEHNKSNWISYTFPLHGVPFMIGVPIKGKKIPIFFRIFFFKSTNDIYKEQIEVKK